MAKTTLGAAFQLTVYPLHVGGWTSRPNRFSVFMDIYSHLLTGEVFK